MNQLLVIGDSHGGSWGWWVHAHEELMNTHGFTIHCSHRGPLLMHTLAQQNVEIILPSGKTNMPWICGGAQGCVNLPNKGRPLSGPPLQELKRNDGIIWCFGEIDARCHIVKIAHQKQTTIETIASEVAHNFIKFVERNDGAIRKVGVRTLIQSVRPAINVKGVPAGTTPNKNELSMFSTVGTPEERVRATKQMNAIFSAECGKRDWLFIDLHDRCANDDGTMDDEPAHSDGCHYQNPAPFLEWFERNKWDRQELKENTKKEG